MAPSRVNASVIVVGGGGTIGSSTALHLVRSGYTPSNITVLDTYPIPSSQSAGNDLNKIMGIRLRNKVDLQLSLEARQMWREDELFKEYFHNTGRLDCAHGETGLADLKQAYQALLDANAGLEKTTEWLDSEDEILKKMPLLDREQIKGWKAVYSQDGGWLAAAKAINAIGEYLRDSGVKFGFGGAGSFKQPLLAEGVCIGVETVDGTRYYADKVVLAAGAWSPVLVDLAEQCVSKFTEKELFNRHLCWCTDTADAALLMCEHPEWKNFVLATGDSGHTFKLLPNIGKHVVELLEGTLANDLAHAWRWRPGTGDALKSRRAAPAKDLSDMPGWKHDEVVKSKL
ncbi:hypothetical protein GGP41_009890 [Bipolaris sorokiniana]|uniref:FAD dependent oxidoreductase domain-containing protein n=1 Tax=Cochliobolus sativus TaxID=45130 RepID=A0A8H5ZEF8_COCSA|nr:hypothetical protein GGP41_009890 [Bipolaris sorokiniana]